MDEDSEVGYLYPTSNIDPVNLEIKILTKRFVVSISISFHLQY